MMTMMTMMMMMMMMMPHHIDNVGVDDVVDDNDCHCDDGDSSDVMQLAIFMLIWTLRHITNCIILNESSC